tara:strand:- start:307 stop:1695 length:1389 start_codon:yes stop_codon:yes gene_type:complete
MGNGVYLSRSQSSSEDATARKKFTISGWYKLGINGDAGGWKGFWSAATDGSNYSSLKQNATGEIVFEQKSSGTGVTWTSSGIYKDYNSWYHIMVAYDSTQASNEDRVKVYINGEQPSGTYGSFTQDQEGFWGNSASTAGVGRYNNNTGNSYMYTGYATNIVGTIGYALAPTVFGQTDSTTGEWKPRSAPSGITYSANGFYLKFENSGAMGTDSSGNGNTFTVNGAGSGYGEIVQATDAPDNNFSTLNSLANQDEAGGTFSKGNLQFVTQQADYSYRPSSIGVSAGKWYCEVKAESFTAGTDPFMIGITSTQPTSNTDELGHYANDWAYREDGSYRNNNNNTTWGSTFAAGDIIGIALDITNSKLYFSKNGTWQESGDPTSGASGTGAISITAVGSTPLGNYFFALGDYDNATGATSTFQTNFGNPSFTVSSSNADANGYGSFEYAVPSGYYALCTKNLNTYG